jgi:hypothetical protein
MKPGIATVFLVGYGWLGDADGYQKTFILTATFNDLNKEIDIPGHI